MDGGDQHHTVWTKQRKYLSGLPRHQPGFWAIILLSDLCLSLPWSSGKSDNRHVQRIYEAAPCSALLMSKVVKCYGCWLFCGLCRNTPKCDSQKGPADKALTVRWLTLGLKRWWLLTMGQKQLEWCDKNGPAYPRRRRQKKISRAYLCQPFVAATLRGRRQAVF